MQPIHFVISFYRNTVDGMLYICSEENWQNESWENEAKIFLHNFLMYSNLWFVCIRKHVDELVYGFGEILPISEVIPLHTLMEEHMFSILSQKYATHISARCFTFLTKTRKHQGGDYLCIPLWNTCFPYDKSVLDTYFVKMSAPTIIGRCGFHKAFEQY